MEKVTDDEVEKQDETQEVKHPEIKIKPIKWGNLSTMELFRFRDELSIANNMIMNFMQETVKADLDEKKIVSEDDIREFDNQVELNIDVNTFISSLINEEIHKRMKKKLGYHAFTLKDVEDTINDYQKLLVQVEEEKKQKRSDFETL